MSKFKGIQTLTLLSCLAPSAEESQVQTSFSAHLHHVNCLCWLLCPRRSAPPCESSGIRATGLLFLPISWTSSQRAEEARSRREGGGRRQTSTTETPPHPARGSRGPNRTRGHAVAAPCPLAQSSQLLFQLQTS